MPYSNHVIYILYSWLTAYIHSVSYSNVLHMNISVSFGRSANPKCFHGIFISYGLLYMCVGSFNVLATPYND